MKKKILLLGGYGVLGRQICTMLAPDTAMECVVAGRDARRGQACADSLGVRFQVVDMANPPALRAALDGVFAVVDTCGPFQGRTYGVAEACIAQGTHYVDVADARAYVEGFARLNESASERGCLLVTGAGTLLAVTSALVDSMIGHFDRITEIHIAISTGNRDARGPASLRSLLSYAGLPLPVMEQGNWRTHYGWSRPQNIRFPAPVGKRRVYLVDTPDLDIFPQRYAAHTVSARAGMQLGLFNHGLYVLARLKRHHRIADLSRHVRPLLKASKMFRAAGDATGGVRVAVRGEHNGQKVEHHAFLIARATHGIVIPASPSVALIRKWVHQGVSSTGAVPAVGLLTLDDIRNVLRGYEVSLVYA